MAPRQVHRGWSSADLQAAARASPFLGALPDAEFAALVRHSHGSSGRRGARLSAPRDDTAAVILEGVAATRTTTREGDHIVDALLGPGDVHGLAAVLVRRGASDELVAVRDTAVLVLPGIAIREAVDRSSAVARICLQVVAAQHAALVDERHQLASSTATARVEQRLLELAVRFGQHDRERILVDLPITQEELASWAHTSRESTARVLQELRRSGIVTTGRRQLVIEDLIGLRARRRTRPDLTVDALLRSIV